MPTNNMNTGVDYSISYYDGASGLLVDLGDVQNVKVQALKHDIKSMPFNRPPRFGYVPDGYRIEFSITRTGGALEDFFVAAEANFNAGSVSKAGYLNQSINNPDGTISRYQFTNFVVFLENHGDIARDKVVTLTMQGMASTKQKIA